MAFSLYTKRTWKALLVEAHAGSPDAQWRVGDAYTDGVWSGTSAIVVRRNPKLGVQWLRRAALAGDTGAMNTIGCCYSSGNGVPRSQRDALRWFRKAWDADRMAIAASNIAKVYRDQGKHRLSFAWFQRAVDAGDGDDLVELANHYLSGRGVRKNPTRAVGLLRRAARSNQITESGRDQANYVLGRCYVVGDGVPRSLARARAYFLKANRDGDHPQAAEALLQMSLPEVTSNARKRPRR